MATRISAALVAVVLALFAPFAHAQQPFTIPFINVLHGGTLGGNYTFPGLSAGSQVSCLGLNAQNSLVTGACGGGSGGPYVPLAGGTMTGGLVTPTLVVPNGSTTTASQMYLGLCPGCTGFSDAIEGLASVSPSFSGSQQTAISGYVIDNKAASGGLGNGVAGFFLGIANVSGANVWGWNTLTSDSSNSTVNSNTGIKLFNEADFNVYSTSTLVEGLALTGASAVQPAGANGVVCHQLGVGIAWNSCIVSQDGHAQNALYVGTAGAAAGNNLSSQPVLFESTDGSGTRSTSVLQATPGNILSVSSNFNVAGSAIFVTPSQFDNSTDAATTAFVHAAGLQVAGQFVVTANTTLTPSQAGLYIPVTTSGVTVTMPAANTVPRGNGYAIHNESSGSITLAAHAGDTIPESALISDANILMESDGVSTWLPVIFSLGNNGGGGGGGNWTAAPVSSISGGLSIASGVLTDQWSAGLVSGLGTGLSIDGSNNLDAQWSVGAVTALSGGLSISGTTLTFTGGGSGNVVGPSGGVLNNDCVSFSGTTGLIIQDTNGFCVVEASVAPGDANYVIPATASTVNTSTLTAARTWTLPAAASTNKSHIIRIADWGGAINGTDTLTIAANGTDTVNGGNQLVLSSQWSECDIQAAGTTSWLATCTIIPAFTPVSNQFLTGITAGGVWSSAQPTFSNLGGQATLAQLPSLSANTILGTGSAGTPVGLTLSGCSISGTVFSCSGGGGGTPGGSTNAVQYNAGSSTFGGVSLTSGELLIGGATVPTAQTVSGDGTLSATGVLTVTETNGVAFGTAATVNTGTSGAVIPLLSATNSWGGAQRGTPSTITISTSTFTPNFNTGQNFNITLVHASCPCTVANPSTTLVAGQSGVLVINQSSTGSDTVGTWGSDYKFSGGTAPTLSTGANDVDLFSYYVASSSQIIVGTGVLNAH